MLTKQQLIDTCDFTRQYLDKSVSKSDQEWIKDFPRAAQHRWQHTLNVLKNAEKILDGEKFNQNITDVVKVSAVMHDISMFVCDHSVHGQKSAEIANQYLTDRGFPDDFTNRVTRAITEHGVDFDTLSPEEMGACFSVEGRILIEADILDKFGVSAVTNALLEFGKDGLLSFECRVALNEGVHMQRAKYFHNYIWTGTGKKMRDDRFGFFLKYLDQLSEEVVEKKSPS